MDQSRPGHQARRLPLIIERSDLTHPVRRLLAVVITATAWGLWIAMWIPFLATLGRYYGYQLPEFAFPSQISLDSFFALARVMPYVLAFAILIALASMLGEKYKARTSKNSERWRPVGMERLATGAALDPELLAQWQTARILYVEHGPLGRVTNASETYTAKRPD
jgi:poly-beta-1,6-N-acetyl-D-glucosamine biosynthesis protein PgaD